MSTHDYVIDNQNGAGFRSDLNNALAAIATNNSSATAPSPTYANMWWADTSSGYLKQRNSANTDWISVIALGATAITTSDIGSQSVSNADTLDGSHASAFQSTLVSGTNIKTINGNSLLGSGNITAGSSTDYGAIGTYIIAAISMPAGTGYNPNTTYSGSSLYRNTSEYVDNTYGYGTVINTSYSGYQGYMQWSTGTVVSLGLSGTWRLLTRTFNYYSQSRYTIGLFVRVS